MRNGTRLILTSVLVSFGMAILNALTFFVALLRQPPGTVFLGTVHYFEDYFFYLNHFFQGAHGAWLTANRYTHEATPDSLIYWSNVLLGKLGGIFFLPPIISYNLSVLFLAAMTLILSFILLRLVVFRTTTDTLHAFLYATFATSLINRVTSNEGTRIFWPFQIWRTPHFAFDRLGGAPHQMVQTILFYLLLLCFFWNPADKRLQTLTRIGAPLAGALLSTVNPIQSAFTMGIIWFAVLVFLLMKRGHEVKTVGIHKLITTSIAVGIAALYTSAALNHEPHIQSKLWEASQHSFTTLDFLIKSIGPVSILACIGLIARFRKLTFFEITGSLILLVGYAVFLSPLPQTLGFSNLRVLFPGASLFWGLLAVYGAHALAHSRFFKLTSPLRIQASILVVFLLVSAPTIHWELQQKIPNEQTLSSTQMYLPTDIYDAYAFLSMSVPYDDVVLANPVNHLDLLVPALSGHTTYSGHLLTTINNSDKQALATRFYAKHMTQQEAKSWLSQNTIKYVLWTQYDGDYQSFLAHYPFFVKSVFARPSSTGQPPVAVVLPVYAE